MSTPEEIQYRSHLAEGAEETKDDFGRPDPGITLAMELGVPYQQAGQVRQLMNELANSRALGNTERVEAIERQLSVLGYVGDSAKALARDELPEGRTTRDQKTVKADAPSSPAVSAPATPPMSAADLSALRSTKTSTASTPDTPDKTDK